MANTTLKNTVTNVTVTLQDLSTSFIDDSSTRKEAFGIQPMPLYTQDSNETDVFDYGGVIKTINFIGRFVGGSLAANKSLIEAVENLIQGQQDNSKGYPLTLTDDLKGTLKVKIIDFTSNIVSGDVQTATWTLRLIESSDAS